MIKFKHILQESEDLDNKVNRKLLNLVSNKLGEETIQLKYDCKNSIYRQLNHKIIPFMRETLALDDDKISDLCWLIFINGPIDYLHDKIKTDTNLYVYEIGYYDEMYTTMINDEDECDYCEGYGEEEGSCAQCDGEDEDCGDCNGTGSATYECDYCGGSGIVSYNKEVYKTDDWTAIYYSASPNLEPTDNKIKKTIFPEWEEENCGELILMLEKLDGDEESSDETELEDIANKMSFFQNQGEINYGKSSTYTQYFSNFIRFGRL